MKCPWLRLITREEFGMIMTGLAREIAVGFEVAHPGMMLR
jgi:hypothetical protein